MRTRRSAPRHRSPARRAFKIVEHFAALLGTAFGGCRGARAGRGHVGQSAVERSPPRGRHAIWTNPPSELPTFLPPAGGQHEPRPPRCAHALSHKATTRLRAPRPAGPAPRQAVPGRRPGPAGWRRYIHQPRQDRGTCAPGIMRCGEFGGPAGPRFAAGQVARGNPHRECTGSARCRASHSGRNRLAEKCSLMPARPSAPVPRRQGQRWKSVRGSGDSPAFNPISEPGVRSIAGRRTRPPRRRGCQHQKLRASTCWPFAFPASRCTSG